MHLEVNTTLRRLSLISVCVCFLDPWFCYFEEFKNCTDLGDPAGEFVVPAPCLLGDIEGVAPGRWGVDKAATPITAV